MRTKLMGLLCCAAILMCSCAQNTAGVTERKTKLAPSFAPLTEIRAGRRNLYIIVKNLDSDYWRVTLDGAKAAGNDYNCNIYYSGTYAESDWDLQAELLDDCVKKKADAVLIAPDDSVRLAPKVSEVYHKGIPVVLIDTTANTDDYNICYMTDNLIAGQNAAAEMIDLMHRKGYDDASPVRIGVMVCTTTSQTINERLAGFFQYWAQNAPQGWKIIQDIRCFEGTAEETVPYAEALMQEYPDITGVFGTNDCTTAGLAKALEENERTDIGIVGFDYSDEIMRLIRNPDFDASTIVQRQYDMSHDGVKAAMQIINGKTMPVKFVDMGVVVVNDETLHSVKVQKVLVHN